MTICLGFHQGDAHLAKRLLQWIVRLGGCKGHKMVLVVDAGCPWRQALDVHQEAAKAFPDGLEIIDNQKPVKGWPQGPNSLFWVAAKRCKTIGSDVGWLWLEPDAIPLSPGWADKLQTADLNFRSNFMGAIIDSPPGVNGIPSKYMNGVAVYSFNAYDLLNPTRNDTKAFDISAAPIMVSQGVNTSLIQCFWGEKDLPPTFYLTQQQSSSASFSSRNSLPLSFVRKDAVLFHRNKDLTLLRLLWERDYPGTIPGEAFMVVLPFHNGDAAAMINNLNWLATMCGGQPMPYGCVLSYERGTIAQFIEQAKATARLVFNEQFTFTYPSAPNHKWPAGANWAWKNTAGFMNSLRRSWLWMESDMIPLVPDWLDKLQSEYAHCGKPVMGAVVPGLGHVQGTAVYPHDILARCPKLFNIPDHSAFDTWAKDCVLSLNHDCRHLMAHVWGIEKGKPHPIIGVSPSFRTQLDFEQWLPKGAVTFHRCKDGSLIKFLRQNYERQRQTAAVVH